MIALPNTLEALETMAKVFGCTVEQARIQHLCNASVSRSTADAARAKGRPIGHYTADQWERMADNSRALGTVGLTEAEIAALIAKMPAKYRRNIQ